MKARRRVLDAHDSTPTIRTNLPCWRPSRNNQIAWHVFNGERCVRDATNSFRHDAGSTAHRPSSPGMSTVDTVSAVATRFKRIATPSPGQGRVRPHAPCESESDCDQRRFGVPRGTSARSSPRCTSAARHAGRFRRSVESEAAASGGTWTLDGADSAALHGVYDALSDCPPRLGVVTRGCRRQRPPPAVRGGFENHRRGALNAARRIARDDGHIRPCARRTQRLPRRVRFTRSAPSLVGTLIDLKVAHEVDAKRSGGVHDRLRGARTPARRSENTGTMVAMLDHLAGIVVAGPDTDPGARDVHQPVPAACEVGGDGEPAPPPVGQRLIGSRWPKGTRLVDAIRLARRRGKAEFECVDRSPTGIGRH